MSVNNESKGKPPLLFRIKLLVGTGSFVLAALFCRGLCIFALSVADCGVGTEFV